MLIWLTLLACNPDLNDDDTGSGGGEDTDTSDTDTSDTDTSDTDTSDTDTSDTDTSDTDTSDTDTSDTDTDTDTGVSSEDVAVDLAAPAWLDESASTATVDSVSGSGSATSLYALGDVGDGSGGSFVGAGDLVGGEFQYTDFTTTADVAFAGDTVIRVQNDVLIAHKLTATGSLTIIAGGGMTLGCGYREAASVHLEAHGPAGFRAECSSLGTSDFYTTRAAVGPAGGITVLSDGPLALRSAYFGISEAVEAGQEGGDLLFAADGPIHIDQESYLTYRETAGPSGSVRLQTSGDLDLLGESYLIGGGDSADSGAVMSLQVVGDLLIHGDSYLIGGRNEPMTTVVEGALLFDQESYIIADGHHADPGGAVLVEAGSVHLLNGSYIIGSTAKEAGVAGARTVVHTPGDLVLDGGGLYGGIYSGGGLCGDGAVLELRAGGSVSLTDGDFGGGRSNALQSCAASAGGDVDVIAAGTITVDGTTAVAYGGSGAPEGSVSLLEDPSLVVGAPDAGLRGHHSLVSAPQSARTALASIAFTGDSDVLVSISADGSLSGFVPADDLVGTPLADGWRFRLALPWGLFDAATVQDVTFTFTP